ncbi:MAG: glycosyltransferase [Iphinoe sp. HA4291-MV1]|jgi:glycosyltransferase involved in cell wall biosynthesis|nr:glycosyltransferase [Iphinoe sp. HA4291-MV1]
MATKSVQGALRIVNLIAKKIKDRQLMSRKVLLKPDKPAIGNVLLSYLTEPFFLKPGQPIPNFHTSYWECRQIAQTLLDMGYCVDVIQYFNNTFIPQKDYVFYIETRWTLQRCAPYLNKDCIKIFHADTAHIVFHNAAEANRLLALQQRRGITLTPQRFEPPNKGLEHADCATILGNEFTMSTFRYAKKPLYRIPTSTQTLYPWSEDKDFDACSRNYIWLGSRGMVHKGLDLVLEAFAQIPDHHLTICGPVDKEEDFAQAYYKELYQTPNIHTIGWIDLESDKFKNILNNCIGIVYPSCSEGGGVSVINCMHAGLIPIVSYEASVDVDDDYGVILKESSVEEIKNSVQMISSLPAHQLKQMAKKAWEFVRAQHTKEKFAENYRNIMEKILVNHFKK